MSQEGFDLRLSLKITPICLSLCISTDVEVLMLLFGVYLCFTVHKAPASFNESKHISWSIYNAIIVSTFILIVNYFTAESVGPDLIYAMVFLNCQVVVTTTVAMIFLPKFYAVHMKVEVKRRDSLKTITGRMKTYTSSGQHRSIAVQTMFTGEETEKTGIKEREQKDSKPADDLVHGKFEKFVPFVYIQGSVECKEP